MFCSCSTCFSAALGDNIIIDGQRNYVGIRCTTSWQLLHLPVGSCVALGWSRSCATEVICLKIQRIHPVSFSVYCSQAVINSIKIYQLIILRSEDKYVNSKYVNPSFYRVEVNKETKKKQKCKNSLLCCGLETRLYIQLLFSTFIYQIHMTASRVQQKCH